MKKKTPRQKIILANDKLVREIIRNRDVVCQKSGKTERLQVCHFYSRSCLRTRWGLDNLVLLTSGNHHFWAHKYPEKFRDFMIERLGKKRFNALKKCNNDVRPMKMFELQEINRNLKDTLNSTGKFPE